MTNRPDPGLGNRAGGGRGDRWTTREDDMPDAVDDGIAVGVPPVPEDRGDPAAEPPGSAVTDPPGSAVTDPPGSAVTDPPGSAVTDPIALATERDEYLLALQRLQADFENYRKRVLRQQEEQSARAALDLVGKLLPVLDTLDLARAHRDSAPDGEENQEASALDQARGQLLDALAKEGLERVDAAGVAFDPVVHDAVAAAPAGDADENGSAEGAGEAKIDEVLRAGYRWRGQVLRPAMVRVRA